MDSSAFKALSDKTRREILSMLRQKDMSAGEIAQHFAISKPSISHHLSILKNSGLVQDVKEGQTVIYSLNMTVLNELVSWFLDLRDQTGNEEKTSAEPLL
ncbi:MAG: autorepressor SdpR family transcription factor [Eubacteriales bacterium]|jgi:ArsR family transcriptional regulator